jgi:hypothetical protein
MNVYKVIFVQNEINSCKKVTDSASSYKSYHYEHDHGKLIYAIIKDESEDNARSIANNIINEVRNKSGGNTGIAQ